MTCGDIADFLIVQADCIIDGAKQSTLFLVEKSTPGVSIQRTPHFMHSAVNGHPEFLFNDVFVADEDILGEIGQGFDLTKEWFTDERLMIAARTVGAAERALQLARDWAVQRVQFGSPIASYQLIQGMLADCAVDIAVNRAFTHQVAWEADQVAALAPTPRGRQEDAARQGLDGQAVRVRGGRPGHRPVRADLRRPRLRPLLPGRAACTASCASTGSGRAPPRSSA